MQLCVHSLWLPLIISSRDWGILVSTMSACVCARTCPGTHVHTHLLRATCNTQSQEYQDEWSHCSFQRTQWKYKIAFFFLVLGKYCWFVFFLFWQLQWTIYIRTWETWDHCLIQFIKRPLSYLCHSCLALKLSSYHFMGISDRSAYLDWPLLDKIFLCH